MMKRTREQKRAALLAQVGALIDEFLDWEEGAERPNLTEIEDAVLKVRERFGRVLAERAIEEQEAQQPAEAPMCPSCGKRLRDKGWKGLDIESRVGLIEVERGYYYCACCHSGFFPPGRAA
jgi:transposase